MSRIKLTEQQKEDVKASITKSGNLLINTWKHPGCDTVMEMFPANPDGHKYAEKFPELYCRKCHVSAPLFEV